MDAGHAELAMLVSLGATGSLDMPQQPSQFSSGHRQLRRLPPPRPARSLRQVPYDDDYYDLILDPPGQRMYPEQIWDLSQVLVGGCSVLLVTGFLVGVFACGLVTMLLFRQPMWAGITPIPWPTPEVSKPVQQGVNEAPATAGPAPVIVVAGVTPVTESQPPVQRGGYQRNQPVRAGEVEMVVTQFTRGVEPNNLQAAPGLEFVSISIQVFNIGQTSQPFNPTDFTLQDRTGTHYLPDLEADNGRLFILPKGEVPAGGRTAGDLLFHVSMGGSPFTLHWQTANQVLLINLE